MPDIWQSIDGMEPATTILLLVAKYCLMSKNVEVLEPTVNCFATATPSITRENVAALAEGFEITALVAIVAVDAGDV